MTAHSKRRNGERRCRGLSAAAENRPSTDVGRPVVKLDAPCRHQPARVADRGRECHRLAVGRWIDRRADAGDGAQVGALVGTDVHRATDDSRVTNPALIGGDAGGYQGIVAGVDGWAAAQQGHGLGRAAVIAQRCQHGVKRLGDGAGQVGADPAGAAVGLADQVVALRGKCSADVGPDVGRRVPRHDRPDECHGGIVVVNPAAKAGGVAADGAVGHRGRAELAVNPAGQWLAELPLMVQLVSVVALNLLMRPPPNRAELPLTVQSVSVVVPNWL